MAKKNSRPNLAARKSASKKAEARKLAQQHAFWEANKKQIITIGSIVLAAIIALALIIDYCYVPANTVRTFMGNLVGMKDNALVREIDGLYYEFGTVETPEGYEAADFGSDMTGDENETNFYFVATDDAKVVKTVYTIGVKERDAASMIETVAGSFNYTEQSENRVAQIGGHDVHYFYAKGLQNEEVADVYIATMTCYVDTIEGSCVLFSLTSDAGALETLPTEEAMLADAEGIFASLTITK